ncbi:MAG: hypothetical protein Q4F67_17435, partial [Propionibacteriaceae bacterium]|nr:hypothetical protein [Propionibacteriaceae bacterium]
MDSFDAEATATPARIVGSLRRTSTIEMTWPDGAGGNLRFDLRGRDLLTTDDGPREVRSAAFIVDVNHDFDVIEVHNLPAGVADLRG